MPTVKELLLPWLFDRLRVHLLGPCLPRPPLSLGNLSLLLEEGDVPGVSVLQ